MAGPVNLEDVFVLLDCIILSVSVGIAWRPPPPPPIFYWETGCIPDSVEPSLLSSYISQYYFLGL
jgi:hypothetical protein